MDRNDAAPLTMRPSPAIQVLQRLTLQVLGMALCLVALWSPTPAARAQDPADGEEHGGGQRGDERLHPEVATAPRRTGSA